MIIRQQKTLSNNHYTSTIEKRKIAAYMLCVFSLLFEPQKARHGGLLCAQGNMQKVQIVLLKAITI